MSLRLTGTIAMGAEPELLRLGIDDPAHYAAWRLKALLEARGVRVTGAVVGAPPAARARRRSRDAGRRPARAAAAAGGARPPRRRPRSPKTCMLINKVEPESPRRADAPAARARRAAPARSPTGSQWCGRCWTGPASRRADYDFSDGSGMSTYNRVSPRGVVAFLRWAGAQPWGAAWRATLPGRRRRRHARPPLPRHRARRPPVRQDGLAQRHLRAVRLHDRQRAAAPSSSRSTRTTSPTAPSATAAMDAALVLIARTELNGISLGGDRLVI